MLTTERTGRPPTPRRGSTYRSYDELGLTDALNCRLHRSLRYRHAGLEDLTDLEHPKRHYNTNDLEDITVLSSEELPKYRRKTMEGLANGFRRTFSVRSRRDSEKVIPLETFTEDNFATVRGAPFGRRRSVSRERGEMLRSSSEGDVRPPAPLPPHRAPRLHRCLRVLGGSWKNLLLCESYAYL